MLHRSDDESGIDEMNLADGETQPPAVRRALFTPIYCCA
jgi:hypothetical protein